MSEALRLTIGHLFPDLLNLYGDRGNILALKNRLCWRGMEAEVVEVTKDDPVALAKMDIVFLGGGSDREQRLVCGRLREMRQDFRAYVEDGGVLAAVCGGYQLLGNYYRLADETIPGLELLDIYTESGQGRLIGNVVLESAFAGGKATVVGFENHGGRTYTGDYEPFGRVLSGFGNNGNDQKEGVIYKNVLGTYLHGPLLPKNPAVADELLSRALERKYGRKMALEPLDDALELEAHQYIVKRFAGEKI